MKFKNILTSCSAGVLIIMLALCTFTAFDSAAAFITAWPARKQLVNWQEKQRQLEHAQWETIRAQLDQALQYSPDNPELLRDLGLAHEAEYILYSAADPSARSAWEKAGQYYQLAILLRPSWPYDRMDLAQVTYRLDETDSKVYSLVKQTAELGAWEPRVQQVVAEIGLRQWDNLPDDIRELTAESIHNGIQLFDNTEGMLRLLRRYNKLSLVCGQQYENEQVVKFCKRYLKEQ